MGNIASEKMTEAILSAWDEVEGEQAPEDSSEETQPVATVPGEEETEDEVSSDDLAAEGEEAEEEVSDEPGEEGEDEESPEEEAEEEDLSGDEEEPAASAFSSDDPQVQAFLAQHGNDVETALREASKFANVLGRQGRELGQLRDRNRQLESELEQVRLFSQDGYMDEEQRGWVEEAIGSPNPVAYVQSAVQAGQYDLARAVVEQAEFTTGQALRFMQAIDRAEGEARPAEPEQPLSHQMLLEALTAHFPDLPQFEQEMTSTLQALGPDHPLAVLSYSQDPEQAAQGIIGLYEIARAKTATLASTREQVKRKSREAATVARKKAVVSSGQATPPQAQAARQQRLMPGLTLEALEAEFDRQAEE